MIRRYLNKLRGNDRGPLNKQESEKKFWEDELERYHQWFTGQLKEIYLTAAPAETEKVWAHNPTHSAILTWHKKHQEVKYLNDLGLDKNGLSGKRILDVGSGPMPSATCFVGADL